jgi:hypothetical protein
VHIKVSVQIENIFLKILTILEENLTLISRIFQDLNCLSVYNKITNFAFHIGGASCVPMSIGNVMICLNIKVANKKRWRGIKTLKNYIRKQY